MRPIPLSAYLFVALMAYAGCTAPALALVVMEAPFVTFDNTGYVCPYSFADLFVLEFNNTVAARGSTVDLAIAFPPATGAAAGSRPGSPLMVQTASECAFFDHTYLYTEERG